MSIPLPTLVAVVRFATVGVGIVALVARFVWGLGSATFEPLNFFGYLTVQSNIAFAIVTAVSAVRGRGGPRLASLRAIAITFITTSGLVFALIVWQSAQRGIRVDVPWSDIVLHFVLPVVALIDWGLAPRPSARLRIVPFVVGYTIVWGLVTIWRGGLVDWYPYYFLDPRQLESWWEFATVSGIAVAVFITVGVGVVAMPHRDMDDRMRWPLARRTALGLRGPLSRRTARDSVEPVR